MRRLATPRVLTTLRGRVAVTFALGGLFVCLTFAVAAYEMTRSLLINQREHTALRRAYVDANFLRSQLATAGVSPGEALTALAPPAETSVLVEQRGQWYSSSLGVGSSAVPASLRTVVTSPSRASAAYQLAGTPAEPRLVVGVPVPSAAGVVYEVTSLAELRSTLQTFAIVLAVGVVSAGMLAAVLGVRLRRAVVQPLRPLSTTAAAIAAGDLRRRLPSTVDPDLAAIVGSFNSMVDALARRIEREVRFTADVSHELRSPLTSLEASVQLLEARRDELSPRSERVLDVLTAELSRMHTLVEDLLELARRDAGARLDFSEVDMVQLVRETLEHSNRDPCLLSVSDQGPHPVHADKRRLQRALLNLLDNADRHGAGLLGVTVSRSATGIAVSVDDGGPGVPAEHRDRVFERFATVPSPRRSTSGAGLGLALVRETVAAHGGTVTCEDRAGRGARFVVVLPEAA